MPWWGEVEGTHRRGAWGVPQGARAETGGHARGEPRGGVRLATRRAGHAGGGHAGPGCGGAEGALDPRAPPRGGRRRRVWVSPPGGGQAPGGVPRGGPGGASPRARLVRQGAGAVCGARAAGERALEALAIAGGALQGEGGMEPESHARDGGAGSLMVPGGGGLAEPPDLLHPADGGETGRGVRAQHRPRLPVTREHELRDKPDAPGAEAHGSWGEPSDVGAVEEGGRQLLCGEQGRGCAVALRQQTNRTDRGRLGTLSLATALPGGTHGLTQWGHARAPCVHGGVVGLSQGAHRQRPGSSTADIGGGKELPRQRLT